MGITIKPTFSISEYLGRVKRGKFSGQVNGFSGIPQALQPGELLHGQGKIQDRLVFGRVNPNNNVNIPD
ncbi:MAG: hypothetical protein ABIP64_12105 [Burkholderiales bacterium]